MVERTKDNNDHDDAYDDDYNSSIEEPTPAFVYFLLKYVLGKVK